MRQPSNEPILWVLFSAGGVISALFIPALLFLNGLAFPMDWLPSPDHGRMVELLRYPVAKLLVFLICSLPLFHWAHRFRFTLYDGLQIKHLNEVIGVLCYGGAIGGTAAAGYLLWNLA